MRQFALAVNGVVKTVLRDYLRNHEGDFHKYEGMQVYGTPGNTTQATHTAVMEVHAGGAQTVDVFARFQPGLAADEVAQLTEAGWTTPSVGGQGGSVYQLVIGEPQKFLAA